MVVSQFWDTTAAIHVLTALRSAGSVPTFPVSTSEPLAQVVRASAF